MARNGADGNIARGPIHEIGGTQAVSKIVAALIAKARRYPEGLASEDIEIDL
jgi:hypothetical protein